MDDPLVYLTRVLTDVILPNLKAVQVSQAEQIAANDRLENSIEDLRLQCGTGSCAGSIPGGASAERRVCAGPPHDRSLIRLFGSLERPAH
jgi:hypothetical protein